MIHYLNNITVNHVPIHEVSIEPLHRDNYREWLIVINSVFGECDSNFTEKYAQLIEKDLKNTDASWKYFAGYCNKKLVTTGVLLVHSYYGYIANIATSLHYRGKGIATAMTVALLQEAKKLNLSYIFLQAAQDSHAAKLYEKIGFQTVAHLNVYVFDATI
jgi:ribosomal protein S18 acetylase RimI-like enzyme